MIINTENVNTLANIGGTSIAIMLLNINQQNLHYNQLNYEINKENLNINKEMLINIKDNKKDEQIELLNKIIEMQAQILMELKKQNH